MKTPLLFLLLFIALASPAQPGSLFIYGEIGAGGGRGPSIRLDLNSVFLKNNIVSVGYYTYHRKAINLPADYFAGESLFGPNEAPQYSMQLTTITYGKMLYIPGIDMMRFSLKGGFAVGTLTSPTQFTPSIPPAPSFSNIFNFGSPSNYYYIASNKTIAGIVLNPSVELPIGRGFGFRLGVTSIVNSYNTLVNVDGSILFGKLRNRHPRNAISNSNRAYGF